MRGNGRLNDKRRSGQGRARMLSQRGYARSENARGNRSVGMPSAPRHVAWLSWPSAGSRRCAYASSFLSRPSALMTRTVALGVFTPAAASRKSRGGCWEKPRALAGPPRRMWGWGAALRGMMDRLRGVGAVTRALLASAGSVRRALLGVEAARRASRRAARRAAAAGNVRGGNTAGEVRGEGLGAEI